MKLCIVCLARSKKQRHDDECNYLRHNDYEYDYMPADTELDFRGNIRKLFILELGLDPNYKNVICSPISVMMPLAKLLLGAKKKSKTEFELLEAVGLNDTCQLKAVFTQTIKELEYLKGVDVALASKIYLSNKQTLHTKFKSKTESIFGSSVELIDADRPADTVEVINRWVSQNTKNMINNIVSVNDIPHDVSLILVNAIYFQGNWKFPFAKAHMGTFHTPEGKIETLMMSRFGQYNYVHSKQLNAKVVEIPYVGDQSAMIIVLPDAKNGLSILLRTLKMDTSLLKVALKNMQLEKVDLKIPKFKTETSLDLKDYYNKMGVTRSTSPDDTELTNIIKGQNVFISKAIHKAIVEVTETGTKAAASTTATFVPLASYVKDFKAKRPFLFYVTALQEQMFAGIINSPVYLD